MHYLIDLISAVGYLGYVVLFLIVFFESFPPTFFLPGDSLLFTVGFLSSQGYFSFPLIVIIIFVACVFGYIFSYKMGKKIRDILLRSNDKYWFKQKHLDYTHRFYEKYGARTIIIGRFVPIVRSFGPALAGIVDMNYRRFLWLTIVGGLIWSGGVTSLGYFLGRSIPNVESYLTPIIGAIIVVSFIPTIIEYSLERRRKHIT